ncbi:MAG: beta-ketoacyl-ACP synthase II [Bacteroidales bacterium]|nr:beta-ketoacyl-ACP synthase II [Bacteroidales bacterium]
MNLKRVVVTGLGVLSPIGNTVPAFWNAMLSGKSGAGLITYFNTENYKTKIACELKDFNILDYLDNKEARKMDPCSHFAMVSTMEALADSGLELETENMDRIGVIFGTGAGGFQAATESVYTLVGDNMIPRFSPFLIPRVLGDSICGNISIHFGFKGPNYVTASACASAANALVDASNFIKLGKADVMVCGGSEACIVPETVAGFMAMRALSTRNDNFETASRPFDSERDGFVLGEGAGALILEEYEHAKARGAHIYAEFAGYGLSADAYHITSPHPEGIAALASMKLAIEDAHMSVNEVDHINMHGTSTQQGDVSECKAIESLFGEHALDMVFNSTKSMTGHLLGAAAAIESVASILAIKESVIPPTINQFKRDEQINPNWNMAANKPVNREVNVALCNSFGFGGHNVSLLFKKL